MADNENNPIEPTEPTTPVAEPNLNNAVNAAVRSQLTRAMKAQEDAIKKQLEDAVAAIKAAVPQAPPKTADDAKRNPEYVALQAQLDEMTRKAAEYSAATERAVQKQREEKAQSDLRTKLTAAGVKNEMVDIAATFLWAKNYVEFDGDGSPLFKGTQSHGFGVDTDVKFPLAEGVDQWLKTKDAALFLPAPGAGTSTPTGGPRGRGPMAGAATPHSQVDVRKPPSDKASPAEKSSYAAAFEAQLAALTNT